MGMCDGKGKDCVGVSAARCGEVCSNRGTLIDWTHAIPIIMHNVTSMFDFAQGGQTLLHLACAGCHSDTVMCLLFDKAKSKGTPPQLQGSYMECKIDVNAQDQVIISVQDDNELFSGCFAHIIQKRRTALHLACEASKDRSRQKQVRAILACVSFYEPDSHITFMIN